MVDEKRYVITVKTWKNQILTYTVSNYVQEDGLFKFTDERTNFLKVFPTSQVIVEEVHNG